ESGVHVAERARIASAQARQELFTRQPTALDERQALTDAVVEAVVAELAEPQQRALGRIEVLGRELDRDRPDRAAQPADDGLLVALDVDLAERREAEPVDQLVEGRHPHANALG